MNYLENIVALRKAPRAQFLVVSLVLCWCVTSAWGGYAESWGSGNVSAYLVANDPSTEIVFSNDPCNWVITALAHGRHNHRPPPIYDEHVEILGYTEPITQDPLGHPAEVLDGKVRAGNVWCPCPKSPGLAAVRNVEVQTNFADGPFIDIYGWRFGDPSTFDGVYTYAENGPDPGVSDADGIGRHDDVFWIEYTGEGTAPASAAISVFMPLKYTIGGAAFDQPEEAQTWWASLLTMVEVYDLLTEQPMGSDAFSDYVSGGPADSHGGNILLTFDADLVYGDCYSLNFKLDIETHAEGVVPEPAAPLLLATALATMLRKRRRTRRL